MRVLRVIHSMNPRIGGPAVAAINSVVSGARAGVESEVAVVVRPGEMCAPWWRELEMRCEGEKVRLMSFPVGAPRLSARFYDPSPALAKWFARLPRGRYDVVHAESPWTASCVTATTHAVRRAIPLAITPHEVFAPFDLTKGQWGRRKVKELGLRAYGRAASLIVCSSPLEMDDAYKSGLPAAKLTWAYHAVVDELAPSELAERSPTLGSGLRVGYLGRLDPKKNVALLIEAIAAMDREVTLQVAGRGDPEFESKLEQLAKRSLPGRAEFIGWVDGRDKAAFFSRIDVLAMPSEYECFGVVAVEALAAGVPVVVGDRVGIAGLVRSHHAGTVVQATTADIVNALRRYRHDVHALAADRARARPAALAETGFAAHGARLVALYSGLLGGVP